MSLHPEVSGSDHAQGPADAPATLVAYADYQCPFCGEAFGVIKQLQEQFSGQLRLVFRNFPLTNMHPEALSAAVVAEYAGKHGHFWAVHDALFENQDQLGPALYGELLREVGLDPNGPGEAEMRRLEERIQADLDGGLRSGVNGTPAFFLNGRLQVIQGSFADLAQPIQDAIDSAG